MSDVEDDLGGATHPAHSRRTWKLLVNALIQRLLKDEVLKSAQDAIERSVKIPGGTKDFL